MMVQTQIDSWASEAVVGWHIWASHNRLGTWHSYRRDQLWHNTPSVVVELDGCPTPHIPGNYHPRSHGLDGPDGPNNAHVTQEPFRLEIKYPLRGGLDQSSYNIVSWGCHKGRESLMEWWSRRSLTNFCCVQSCFGTSGMFLMVWMDVILYFLQPEPPPLPIPIPRSLSQLVFSATIAEASASNISQTSDWFYLALYTCNNIDKYMYQLLQIHVKNFTNTGKNFYNYI